MNDLTDNTRAMPVELSLDEVALETREAPSATPVAEAFADAILKASRATQKVSAASEAREAASNIHKHVKEDA